MATDDRLERWIKDARLVEQESEAVTAANKDALAVEASLTELDDYLHTLSPEDHQIALDGIEWYNAHYNDDNPIFHGREDSLS